MTDVTVEDVLRESSKLLSAGKHNEAIELMTNALADSVDARHALTLNPCEATMVLINHYLKKAERLPQ